jgi:hypothetical protein
VGGWFEVVRRRERNRFLFVERQQWGGVGFVKEERCDQLHVLI